MDGGTRDVPLRKGLKIHVVFSIVTAGFASLVGVGTFVRGKTATRTRRVTYMLGRSRTCRPLLVEAIHRVQLPPFRMVERR